MDLLRIAQVTERLTTGLDQRCIAVHAERCLNLRDKTLGCDRCQQACPVEAITLEPDVRLEDDRCMGCGACLHRCPTGVFTGADDLLDLLTCVENLTDRDHLEMMCSQHPTAQASLPWTQAVVRIRGCLASLGPSAYISLKALGVTTIMARTDACGQCVLKQAQATIEQSAAEAQQFLAAWGAPDFITVSSGIPAKTVKRPVFSTSNPPMSRRGFFARVTGGKGAHLHKMMAGIEQDEPDTPRERRRLLVALCCLPSPPDEMTADDLPLVVISAPGGCTACGVCDRACPTAALRLDTADDRFALSFDGASCVDCRLCLNACPSRTLRRDPAPFVGEWLQVAPRVIASGALKRCPKCRAPFAGDGDLCPTCQFRRLNPFGSSPHPGT